eukprot:jgi/Mesen1/2430/ME000157S01571
MFCHTLCASGMPPKLMNYKLSFLLVVSFLSLLSLDVESSEVPLQTLSARGTTDRLQAPRRSNSGTYDKRSSDLSALEARASRNLMPKVIKCDSIRQRRLSGVLPTVAWTPEPGKYLLGICSKGQVTNQLMCMTNYFLAAASLNRTLVIPPVSMVRTRSSQSLYDWSVLLDIPRAQSCLGANAIISLEELQERLKGGQAASSADPGSSGPSDRPHLDSSEGRSSSIQQGSSPRTWGGGSGASLRGEAVRYRRRRSLLAVDGLRSNDQESSPAVVVDELRCWDRDCEGELALWRQALPGIRFPADVGFSSLPGRHSETAGAVVRAFGDSRATLLCVGDIAGNNIVLRQKFRYKHAEDFPPLRSSCGAEYMHPHPAIVNFAQGFSRDILGENFAAIHLRRGDFYYLQHQEGAYAINGVAKVLADGLRGQAIRTLFFATNAHPSELEILEKILKVHSFWNNDPMPRIVTLSTSSEYATFEWARGWNVLEMDKVPYARGVLEKHICVYAKQFFGTPKSTFSMDVKRRQRALGEASCGSIITPTSGSVALSS